MTLRLATVDDEATALALIQQCLDQSPIGKDLGLQPGEQPARAQVLFRDCVTYGQVWFAEAGGEVAGLLAVAPILNPITTHHEALVVAWWVSGPHQGGRIGHNLLGAAEQWARQNGLDVLKIGAPPGARYCRGLRRRGFTPTELILQLRL